MHCHDEKCIIVSDELLRANVVYQNKSSCAKIVLVISAEPFDPGESGATFIYTSGDRSWCSAGIGTWTILKDPPNQREKIATAAYIRTAYDSQVIVFTAVNRQVQTRTNFFVSTAILSAYLFARKHFRIQMRFLSDPQQFNNVN